MPIFLKGTESPIKAGFYEKLKISALKQIYHN